MRKNDTRSLSEQRATVEPDSLFFLYYILSPQGSYPILTLTLSDKNISSFFSEAELLSETAVELVYSVLYDNINNIFTNIGFKMNHIIN